MATQTDFIRYSIKIGLKTLDRNFPIQSIMVDKHINKIPYAKVVFYDGNIQSQSFSIADTKIFGIGSNVVIQAGHGDKLETIFQGVLAKLAIKSSHIGASSFVVTCRDVAYKTTLRSKTMHFQNCKDSDIFKKILSSYDGLSTSLEATSITHESVSQCEVSDWDFINIRAEANQQIVLVNNGKITIQKPKTTGKASMSYRYGVDFIDFNAEIDAKDAWAGAFGGSWNVKEQQVTLSKASDDVDLSTGNISYGTLLGAADKKPISILHAGISKQEAKTLASSLLNRSRLAKIKGSVTVLGNSKLQHGMLINIQKGSAHFEGDAYVSGIKHFLSEGIWHTALTIGLDTQRYIRKYNDIISLAAAGTMPPIYGLQIGIVKKISEDPQKLHRIFVHFPLIQTDKKAGTWCRLASFYATNQAGGFFMPEINDEVVVGFINDDVRCPIILGSMYSDTHAPPHKMDQKNPIKSFVSKKKLTLSFNDDGPGGPAIDIKTPKGGLIQVSDADQAAGIQITDQNGNKVILNSEGIKITSRKDIILNAGGNIKLNALGKAIIKASSDVNLSGVNINATATMKASLSGNASTEVTAKGTTIVKGAAVLIN